MEKQNNQLLNRFETGANRKNTNSIKWDACRKNENYFPFWIADSDYATCECIIESLKQRINNGSFGYTFISNSYYEAIKNWIKDRYNYNINNEYIVPTYSVVTALSILINILTKENDKIVISSPVYNQFFNVINANNRVLVDNKLIEKEDTYVLDFTDLENKLKDAKMYILCNPHNPVGRVWKKEEVDEVVRLCKKYDCYLISDEIHCDIVLDGNKFNSVGAYLNEYDNIVICMAPSKTFNIAGLKDANVIIKNEKIKNLYKKFQDKLFISNPNLIALAACESAYINGHQWVDAQNEYINENKNIVCEFFKENLPKAKIYKLEGTYLMWINLSYLNISQEELLSKLNNVGVHVNSGTDYSKDYEGYIRLNIATSRNNLYEGLKMIKKAIVK